MRSLKRFAGHSLSYGIAIVLIGLSVAPTYGIGQTHDNAVWQSSTAFTGSPAFIDASTFTGDICGQINLALQALPAAGGVVDARGIVNPTGGAETAACAGDPFNSISVPSTVLLPASTIPIEMKWTLPASTRLIGEGRFTIVQACVSGVNHCSSTFAVGGDMIDMGSSSITGSSIEHLKLDGNGLLVNGIVNNNCGDSCYVTDVNFSGFGKATGGGPTTALTIGAAAAGSGPYTNLNYGTNGVCSSSGCPACVTIQASTRGLHGITCSGAQDTTGLKGVAIFVGAGNNTIEDAHLESFADGIDIGNDPSVSTVSNVLISNVSASGPNRDVINVVHICGPNGGTSSCPANFIATDVTILHATNGLDSHSTSTNVIQDDVSGVAVGITPANTASTVGMYALGEPYLDSNSNIVAVPRFTTAPGSNAADIIGSTSVGVPTWAIGSSAPPASSSCTSYTAGALYSNTSGASGNNNTLYVCINAVWHQFAM
jgi:hypothetical protein